MIQRMQRSGGTHRSQQEPGCSPQRKQARTVLWRQHLRQQHEVAALTFSVPPRKIDETQQRLCIVVIRKPHVGGPLHSLVNLDCSPLSGVVRAQVGHGSSCQRVGGRFCKEALDAAVNLGAEVDSAAAAAVVACASEPAQAAASADRHVRSNAAARRCSSYAIRPTSLSHHLIGQWLVDQQELRRKIQWKFGLGSYVLRVKGAEVEI
jgi:hypothetical protein